MADLRLDQLLQVAFALALYVLLLSGPAAFVLNARLLTALHPLALYRLKLLGFEPERSVVRQVGGRRVGRAYEDASNGVLSLLVLWKYKHEGVSVTLVDIHRVVRVRDVDGNDLAVRAEPARISIETQLHLVVQDHLRLERQCLRLVNKRVHCLFVL